MRERNDRLRMAPLLANEAAEGWPTQAGFQAGWTKPIDEMVNTLQFCREMLEELSR